MITLRRQSDGLFFASPDSAAGQAAGGFAAIEGVDVAGGVGGIVGGGDFGGIGNDFNPGQPVQSFLQNAYEPGFASTPFGVYVAAKFKL